MTNTPSHNNLNEKSDEELISIIQTQKGFSEEFLAEAKKNLVERGYEINEVEENSKLEIILDENEYYIYSPFVVAVIMLVLLHFKDPFIYCSNGRRNLLVLVFVYESIVLYWSYQLCKKFNLKIWLWMITGIFFGPLSLLCLNVAIWVKPGNSKKEKM